MTTERRILTKDAILTADDLKKEEVDLTEYWGGVVFVREMSGTERRAFEVDAEGDKLNDENIRAKMAAFCICDENGTSLFTQEDAEALGNKSAKAMDIVFEVASRLSGLAAESAADAAKELAHDPLGVSSSDSAGATREDGDTQTTSTET